MATGGTVLGRRLPVMMKVPFLRSLPTHPCHTFTASLAATYGDLIMMLMSRSRSESVIEKGFSGSEGGVSAAAFQTTTDGNSRPADFTLSNTAGTAAGEERSAWMWNGLEEVSADDGVERETVATRYPASTKPLASAVPMLEPTPNMTATSEFEGAIVFLCAEVSGFCKNPLNDYLGVVIDSTRTITVALG